MNNYSPTNVCIDVSSLPYNRGVSRYTQNLVRSLLQEKSLNLSVYGSSFRQYDRLKAATIDLGLFPDQVLIDRIPPNLLPLAWKFAQFLPYRKSARYRRSTNHQGSTDHQRSTNHQKSPQSLVFHAWDWQLPPTTKGVSLVTTIHDLAMLKFPKTAHPKILAHHRKVWSQLKKRQAQIVAVSNSTKQDIIQLLEIPAQRITVVPEALPAEIKSASITMSEDEYRLIRDQLKLNRPFLLFVGTTEPRKNLKRIIRAWEPLASDFQLIIAGARGWDDELDSISSNPNLRFNGPVDNRQLSVLYAEANALVFASLYEGFGLPILEAFYHGTPVITSNNSGMAEVAGNAAELVDPSSVESIRAGIKTILNEDIEAGQLRLKKMIIRGQMFSWELAAKKMVGVYEKAAAEVESSSRGL